MTEPTAADWTELGLAPTTDADAVRAAYRARLKQVSPETDPDGFQALRQAYETVLAACACADSAGQPDTDETPFLVELRGYRVAGDEAGAIALLDRRLASMPPGSGEGEALEDALLEHVALSRSLSPGLFRYLAERFDWQDTQGHAARQDAERHSIILDRLAAEEWFAELPAQGRLGAVMRGPADAAIASLAATPLSAEERQEVRSHFDALMNHSAFVMPRFDGGTLALLRESVEGPPLLGDASDGAAPDPRAESRARANAILSGQGGGRRWLGLSLAGLIGAAIVAKVLLKPSTPTYVGKDTALAETVALPLLKNTDVPWLDFEREPDGVRVSWAPIMRMRHAVKELRVGYNQPRPDTAFPLPEFDAPIGFMAPDNIKTIVMRVQTTDGEWSEVRRYTVPHGSAK